MSRTANFDKLALGEVSVSLLGEKTLIAKFKLVSAHNGRSYGSTTKSAWSKEVWAKFDELKELLEQEADAVLFEDSQPAEVAAEVGLGELFSDDTDSV